MTGTGLVLVPCRATRRSVAGTGSMQKVKGVCGWVEGGDGKSMPQLCVAAPTISALHRLPPALSSSATCPPFLTAPCPFSRSIYRHLSSSFISSRHRPSVLIFTLATFPAHRRPLSLSLSFSLALSLSTLAATFFAVLSSSFGLSSLPSPRTRSRRSMSPPRRSCDASHSN